MHHAAAREVSEVEQKFGLRILNWGLGWCARKAEKMALAGIRARQQDRRTKNDGARRGREQDCSKGDYAMAQLPPKHGSKV
jgi:hypothetical protein